MPSLLARRNLAFSRWGTVLALGFVAGGSCLAQAQNDAVRAMVIQEPVVVTATRTEVSAFDVPASIDRVGGYTIRDGQLQVNVSESLGLVPGLLARDRQNYAQDVQISVRGFGARSTFGIRGVRLYVDGIPATLPDGQGQISNIELGSTDRIEILRGPFSSLYGNSSGGVIQVFTEDGAGAPTAALSAAGGSFGTTRVAAKVSGSSGALGFVAGGADFRTDGYREHSAAERRIGNAKLKWALDAASSVTLIANSVALPKAQDALGLSRTQMEADPRGVDPSAITFDTRKTVDQTQFGVIFERQLESAGTLRALVYNGQRNTVQFQSIPVSTQAGAVHPGGVIVLGRDYRGTDLRWTGKIADPGRPITLVAGLAYDTLREHRQGYQNFVGTTLGVQGALRRDEINEVASLDPYVQASWRFAERWTLNAGVRHSGVRFRSSDRYVVGINPDDSGSVDYSATLPVLGLLFALSDGLHLYATAGVGFETPTLNELAYRPSGATGLNLGLRASRSDNHELGLKSRMGSWGTLNVALFESRTRDEIVVLSNVGGRSTYQNAGATQRRGVEAAWRHEPIGGLHLQLAYTLLDARYRDGFLACVATPCATPSLTIAAGNLIPGVARSALTLSAAYGQTQGWRAGVEWRALSRVPVNDANSDSAAGQGTVGVNVGYVASIGAWELSGYARVMNIFNRRYAGSVIVNEGNSRYFEPAPGRNWIAGASAMVAF